MALPAVYDPRVVYVARRHITVAGKEYKQGEPVPRAGVDERDYHQMFARRKIVPPYDVAPSAPDNAAPSAPSAENSGKEEETITDPAGGLVPKAKGWFAVWHGGKLIRNVRGEAAANALLAELRGESTSTTGDELPLSDTLQDVPESAASTNPDPVLGVALDAAESGDDEPVGAQLNDASPDELDEYDEPANAKETETV